MTKPSYVDALRRSCVLEVLAAFDPRVAGTPPLGLCMPASDIDVLCHAPDADLFGASVWAAYRSEIGFAVQQWTSGGRPVIAKFTAHGWSFEIFGQALLVDRQEGWRHFVVERRLLAVGGVALYEAVMRERRAGAKTEPAFAKVLHLEGDPYKALLDLESCSDDALVALLAVNGLEC